MKHNTFKLTPVSTLLLALCSSAMAQQSNALPDVTIQGSPIIESNQVNAFAGFSTKVTEAQVKSLGALDLPTALRMTPGVQISRYNEVGSYSGDQGGNVYVRGMGASRPGSEIKAYLDGVPLYMGVWNHPLMDLLPLQGIRSIDVQKGPQNAVSGNNLGAVHLQSKTASKEGVQGEANVAYGSFSTTVLQASLLGRQGDLDFSVAAGHAQTNGDRPNADGTLDNAMGRINFKLNRNWSVGSSFLVVRNEVGDPGDARYAVSSAPIGPYQSNGVARNDSSTNLLTAFLAHHHEVCQDELKVYVNQGHNNLTQDPNWMTFDSGFRMSGFKWKESLNLWQGGEVSLGVDHDRVSGTVSGPHVGSAVGTPFGFGVAGTAEVPTFKVTSAFFGVSQNVALSGGWQVQPSVGIRAYDSNTYESKVAPNAGVTASLGALSLYANYNEGILYPGAETYTLTRAIPMSFAADNGWDRLSPTKDRHTELGVHWGVTASTSLDVSVFQDQVSKRYVWSGFNAGTFAPAASGTWSNNYPDYQIHGVEAALRHQFGANWAVFGGVTALDPSLSNLPYAPKTALSLGVNGTVGAVRLSLDAQYQSDMYSSTQDRGDFNPGEVESFTVANARVAYPVPALGKKGELYLGINNLFNANYAYNAGYPMAGRNFRVGLVASF